MKLKGLLIPALTILLFFAVKAEAQLDRNESYSSMLNSFQYFKEIQERPIEVPTVFEFSLNEINSLENKQYVVVDSSEETLQPSYLKKSFSLKEVPVNVTTSIQGDNPDKMIDDNLLTYTNFSLPKEGEGNVVITLVSSSPITSSSLKYTLDENVSAPTTVQIEANVEGKKEIVKAKSSILGSGSITFPKTTSDKWDVTFTYDQPLRISDLEIYQVNTQRNRSNNVRFLAQPGHSYRVYFNPDQTVSLPVQSSRNLSNVSDHLVVQATSSVKNPEYVIADSDADGIPDISDNCRLIKNHDQSDVNNNGIGDLCDDFDKDGFINTKDNCPNHPNRDQGDIDADGLGDVCDDEESRITERYPWTPWIGIIFAFIVIATLFYLTAKSSKYDSSSTQE